MHLDNITNMTNMTNSQRNAWKEVFKLCEELGMNTLFPEHMYRNPPKGIPDTPLDRVLAFIRYLNEQKKKENNE